MKRVARFAIKLRQESVEVCQGKGSRLDSTLANPRGGSKGRGLTILDEVLSNADGAGQQFLSNRSETTIGRRL